MNLIEAMPFSVACGVEVDVASPEEVTGRLAWQEDRCTVGGVLHGGALMTLADSLGAICAFLNLTDGATTSTLESIRDDDGKLVAIVTQTQAVLSR
jgi:acyl-coenzyme A thioesterase PaaI-like protein